MLIINLFINAKPIKAIGIQNIGKLNSKSPIKEYMYNVYIANENGHFICDGKPKCQVIHDQKDGADRLAAIVLQKLTEKI